MMKIAIFSDVHANLQALEAVWTHIEREVPDAVYCLGDIVGYGAHPDEVIEFIKSRNIPTVMGNYDEGVGFDLHDCGCAYKDSEQDRLGKLSLQWSREHTSDENKRYLQSLPMKIRLEEHHHNLLLLHGSPRKINEYLYEDRPQATFERIAKVAGTDVLLFGHTHLPYQKFVKKTLFVNTGSVGKPKGGDPRAGYITLALNGDIEVAFHRVDYDAKAAADAVRDLGLPPFFASLLESGGLESPRT